MAVVGQPILTRTDQVSAATGAGVAVKKNDTTKLMAAATSGIADGISLASTQQAKDQIVYAIPSSMVMAQMNAAVTDTTVPLKASAGGATKPDSTLTDAGALTPCTSDGDAIVAWPMQTCASIGSFIEVQVAKGYYYHT